MKTVGDRASCLVPTPAAVGSAGHCPGPSDGRQGGGTGAYTGAPPRNLPAPTTPNRKGVAPEPSLCNRPGPRDPGQVHTSTNTHLLGCSLLRPTDQHRDDISLEQRDLPYLATFLFRSSLSVPNQTRMFTEEQPVALQSSCAHSTETPPQMRLSNPPPHAYLYLQGVRGRP